MTVQSIPHQGCPVCGHNTIHAVAGRCTVFVPGRTEGTLAEYCGCDCYKAVTGRDMRADFADVIRGARQSGEGQANEG